jgi:hypothetical protein
VCATNLGKNSKAGAKHIFYSVSPPTTTDNDETALPSKAHILELNLAQREDTERSTRNHHRLQQQQQQRRRQQQQQEALSYLAGKS